MNKQRIDKLLVERGIAESRTKAQAMVMSGVVLVDERRVEKPSEQFSKESDIRIKGESAESKYVGRGGLKLEKALADFHICPIAYVCLDVGSSTGGFTDCLLKHGAARVYAVDAGTNQLVWELRNDPRVTVLENTNARYLTPGQFPVQFDLITVDVSFISVTKILPALVPLLGDKGQIVVLVKPQFEVGKGEVGKGGIVREESKRSRVIVEVGEFAEGLGMSVANIVESPITGAGGNVEYLMMLAKRENE